MAPLALITGATRGIGRAVAEGFAGAGFDVFAVARSSDQLAEMQQAFRSAFPEQALYTKAADLSQTEAAKALSSAAVALRRPIDVLVNNAGAFVPDSLLDKDALLPQQIATNLYSAYYLTKGLLPTFVAQGEGYIFNICSVASLQAYPGGASYCISKYALRGFSQVLRAELIQTGVRVSCVLPGAVLTDSWKGTKLPQSRFIRPEDIASALLSAYRMSPSATVEEILIRPQQGDI